MVNLMTLIFLVHVIKLIAPVNLVERVDLIDPKKCFSIYNPKFLMKLALTKVCILALGGSFCCMSLMAF